MTWVRKPSTGLPLLWQMGALSLDPSCRPLSEMMEDCNNGRCHECTSSNIRPSPLMPGTRLIDGSLMNWTVMSPCSKIPLTLRTDYSAPQSDDLPIKPPEDLRTVERTIKRTAKSCWLSSLFVFSGEAINKVTAERRGPSVWPSECSVTQNTETVYH